MVLLTYEMLCFSITYNLKSRKFLRKNQYGFETNRSATLQIQTIRGIIERVQSKESRSNTTVRRFLYVIRSRTQRKDRANTTCILSSQTNCYYNKNTTALVYSLCWDYELRTSIELIKGNGLVLKKEQRKRYSADSMTDAHYNDDIVLLTNTPAQAECVLPHEEQAAGSIGLEMNANKIEL